MRKLKPPKFPIPLSPWLEQEADRVIAEYAREELAEWGSVETYKPDTPVHLFNYEASYDRDDASADLESFVYEPRNITIPMRQFVVCMGQPPEYCLGTWLNAGGSWPDGEGCAWLAFTDDEESD